MPPGPSHNVTRLWCLPTAYTAAYVMATFPCLNATIFPSLPYIVRVMSIHRCRVVLSSFLMARDSRHLLLFFQNSFKGLSHFDQPLYFNLGVY